jgi:hypothetical protein
LTRAFNYCGISWNSRFIESQRFKRMLMAYPGGDLPTIDSTQANNDSLFSTENNNVGAGTIINTNVSSYSYGGPIWLLNNLNSVDIMEVTVTQDNLNQAQSSSPLLFVAASSGLFNVHYYGDHDLTFTDNQGLAVAMYGNYRLELLVYKNNILISFDTIYSGALDGQATGHTESFNFDYSRQINLLINDTLSFEVRYILLAPVILGGAVGMNGLRTQIVSNTAELDILKQPQTLTAGGTVSLGVFLPDMTCDVFFKGLVTAFNLYVKPSVTDPTILEIEPLADFYRSSGDAIDWTYKIDRSKEIQIEPTINFSAKNYKFNFETDDDYWNGRYFDDVQEQYGSFIVESQSQFATNETNFKLPFSQKVLSTIPDTSPSTFTDLTVPRAFQIKFNEDGTSLVERKKGKPFLVQLGGLRTGDWIHVDENGTPFNETSYPYVGHLDNLDSPSFDFNFGVPDYVFWSTPTYPTNNLYLYHEKFIKELISRFGKKVTCSVMLRPSDINSLDFRNLINIDGVVYRLLKVSDYQSGKNTSTVVELIRIIEGEGIQTTIVTPP